MRNMHDNNNNTTTRCSSSSSRAGGSTSLQPQPDELSLFLHQILLRSSSSSSSSSSSASHFRPESSHLPPSRPHLVSAEAPPSSCGLIFPASGGYLPGNVSYSVGGAFENNDFDEYDCESEEGLEALVEEVAVKPGSGRNSSKRTRAAEVHNLSEKRRRSRINEKMKALQKLIPNSNKTDKASMLDEAIEYLKQLQLQVQMLSMRSGLSLRPMCLPGVLQPLQLSQMRKSFGEGNTSFHMNMSGTLSMNHETTMQNAYSLPNNQCSLSNLPSISNTAQIINPETSFGLESSIYAHLESSQLHTSSEKIRGEDMLPHQQLDATHSKTNPLVSLPFAKQASIPNQNAFLEPHIIGRERSEGVLLKNIEQNQIIRSHTLNSMHVNRRAMRDDLKIERS